ncbi:MAG: GntR family transcriptional regulator [Proteobacteria bacterium]|nr:GntR family transcriptional regulator [Pseudomonadota bacterium]
MNGSALNPRTPLAPPVPLYEQVRESVRGDILNGTLQHHARIPSEKELMTLFGVSRITVRQALGDLERDGMIFRIPGKGSYVAKPEEKATQELARLQGFAEAMAEQGYSARNRVVGLANLPADAHIAERLRIPVGAPVTEIRRVRYLDDKPISFDITYVREELGRSLAREDLAGRDLFLILEKDYGLPLGHADQSIQALIADDTLAAYLDVQTGSPVLHIERLAFTRDGTPIEFDYVYYRGDAFRYRLRIDRERR